ncbi:MAG: protease SohB [Coxiellaceae bacterium]|jgi:serine protease SohB|nr:protease SohB [Coxiellaceae bacterium]
MNFLSEYGLFLAQSLTIVIAIIATCSSIAVITGKNRDKERIEITNLNKKYQEIKELLNRKTLIKSEFKKLQKKEQQTKAAQKKLSKNTSLKSRTFVLEFNGDTKASAVENLRKEITAILTTITHDDEVLIKIESSGGIIHGYGLAASQLKRIRDRKIPLTVVIDKVAASGGYLMACVADRIFAAPFAIIGSIGVIAQLPNFNRFLKKNGIDFEQLVAGKYKRTLSLFAKNTREGKEKTQQDVEEAHTLFKNFVSLNRPNIDISKIATGEIWYGTKAKELNLIDNIITSDDYLLNRSKKSRIFKVKCTIRNSLTERFSLFIQNNISKILKQ